MPVFPIVFERPVMSGSYPHMARRDALLWERYLRTTEHAWQGFAYDVALGGTIVEDAEADPEELRGWQYSTAEKIDVVANRGDEHWLIEVRPNARVGAVGAALCYLLLAQREPWTTLPMIPAVLTDNMALDVRWCAQQLGVQVILVPDEPIRVLE